MNTCFPLKRLFLVIVMLTWGTNSWAQLFYGSQWPQGLITLDGSSLGSLCGESSCPFELLNPNTLFRADIGIDQSGNLYYYGYLVDHNRIWEIDPITGQHTEIYSFPLDVPALNGCVTFDGNIFYGITNPWDGNILYRTSISADTSVALGYVGPIPHFSDMTIFQGEIYANWTNSNNAEISIIKIDTMQPASVLQVLVDPQLPVYGLTASDFCHTLIGTVGIESNQSLAYISLLDGAITPICPIDDEFPLTSIREHQTPIYCEALLDLDCNNSSGATDADFNADSVDCLNRVTTVSDIDIGMHYDAIISEMRIEITGLVPDAPFEILVSTGTVSNIDVTGDGTDMITLSNAGSARSTNFKDALRLIRYQNNAESPTGGLRTVEVQFTTESGSQSNIATAFIQVVELPLVPVDLGPDQQICEGETTTFDAGIPGAMYEWSNGDNTQIITVTESGEYIVTVADGQNCPGIDTVVLDVLPVINVSLSGDTEICDNEQATIIINTNTPFGLNIDITSNPGSPFNLPNVTGTTTFNDLINDQTTYTITSVTPSQDACITLSDPEHIIDVYPSYIHAFDVSICDGDSVWLGFYWETEAGVYENTFASFDGCDSVVTTTITIVPAIQLNAQGTTCNSSEVGIFITTIDNPTGCDTVVTTTISLAPSDTTTILTTTCNQSQSGTSFDTLSNLAGCDSLIISTISYTPPSDTTFVNATTCDSAQLGISQLIIPALDGCDSLIVTTTFFGPSDTTLLAGTSCDSASIGVFLALFQNQNGCDSLIISTITAGVPDTTFTNGTSCDSASLGTFEFHFTSITGCDSTVFHTITFFAQDSTFINDTTCDPSQTGITVQTLTNQFGCDSIVTTTISLLPSDSIEITDTTCDPNEAGIFIEEFQNIFGCDSIVTTTISLLPSSNTDLFETTCISSQAGVFVSTLINQNGCDSIVTLTVSLVDADTTRLTYMTCFENEIGITETLYTGMDGCDSLVIEQTMLFGLPFLNVESLHDYNGYDISCAGGQDGGAVALIFGFAPFSYSWSTSEDEQTITGLASGNYEVTITDGNGCMESGEIILTEPTPFVLGFEISEPDCFDNALGSINALASGGVAPYTYSIDGVQFQTSSTFNNLTEGVYQITTLDANACEVKEIISINVPLSVQVELGDNQVISIGDSAELEAIINLPFDSLSAIQWIGIDSIDCPNCLTQIVAPVITTAYSVSVTTVDGCSDRDSVTVFVSTDHQIYTPNIFSPNDDGVNDELTIGVSEGVEEITSFEIFDRWGNLVYGVESTIAVSWDGRMKGRNLNPGVFTYKMMVRYRDGVSEVKYGDVTLVR